MSGRCSPAWSSGEFFSQWSQVARCGAGQVDFQLQSGGGDTAGLGALQRGRELFRAIQAAEESRLFERKLRGAARQPAGAIQPAFGRLQILQAQRLAKTIQTQRGPAPGCDREQPEDERQPEEEPATATAGRAGGRHDDVSLPDAVSSRRGTALPRCYFRASTMRLATARALSGFVALSS